MPQAIVQAPKDHYLDARLKSFSGTRLSTREDVLNVFTPTSVVTSPAKFVGREQNLEDMIDTLLSAGADLIVYGERGSGKSSITHMLHQIATGDLEILDYYGLSERLHKKGFFERMLSRNKKLFNVIWVDGRERELDDVLREILMRRRAGPYGPGLQSYIPRDADKIEISSKLGFNRILTAEGETRETYVPPAPVNVREAFDIALQKYRDQHDEELIIIIDEFETIKGRSELAPYLKSTREARFVLVGIAESTPDLIGGHASVARETHAIELAPMNEDELRMILVLGSYILSNYCQFSEDAASEIIRNCYGSPFWSQFMAKALVKEKLDSRDGIEDFFRRSTPEVIDKPDVIAMVEGLPDNSESRFYEQLMTQATLDDDLTAKVLLHIAASPRTIVSSSRVVSTLEEQEGISKEITLETIEGLIAKSNSPFVERTRIRDIVSFSFDDPNFKRYIRIRNAGLPQADPAA